MTKKKKSERLQIGPQKKVCASQPNPVVVKKPPQIEATPIKSWHDEHGNHQVLIDKERCIRENITAYEMITGVKDTELAAHIIFSGMNSIKILDKTQKEVPHNIVMQSLYDMKAKDSVESSLITQAIALYSQGMSCLAKSDKCEHFDHMQYYGNLATKFLRLHNETIEALSRYRRGGEQRVVIQHQQVNVSGQGQAMVGQFHAEGGGGITKKSRRQSMLAICGAKARTNNHQPCRQPAMANGRCRLHGGLCTGARTEAGLRRIKKANTKHGFYSAAAIAERRASRAIINALRGQL